MTESLHYNKLLKILEDKALEKHKFKFADIQKYTGNEDINLELPVPETRELVKAYFRSNELVDLRELIVLLNSLSFGKYHEEKWLIGEVLAQHKQLRNQLSTNYLDSWLGYLHGWAQVDSLCQSVFTAREILENWEEWDSFLHKLSKSSNVNKRRASLVFLTGPLRKSRDQRLIQAALRNIGSLSSEKNILITKAISWLLRSGVTNFRTEIEIYIQQNKDKLPAISVRETTRKLNTGKK
jgi:3-methyladenine DNA glycosylase AlkD